jgi:hypothetical protein
MANPSLKGMIGTQAAYIYLTTKVVELGDWRIDGEGTVGHVGNGRSLNRKYYGRVQKSFNAIEGLFQFFCVACGEKAPEALHMHSKLRRLG